MSDDPNVMKLVHWLQAHPNTLEKLVLALRLQVPKCEGVTHECDRPVITRTPCRTGYSWDGEGENPNKDPHLCIACSKEYDDLWSERWREYYASVGP